MPDALHARLTLYARDGNLDVEDVGQTLEIARADGRLGDDEAAELRAALDRWRDTLEPAARRYLEETLARHAPGLVNRVLLAPHPRGRQRDLCYARADVTALQEALGRVGHATTVDGDFGPATCAPGCAAWPPARCRAT